MRVDFDNCKENEGPVEGDRKDFDINQFGKVSKALSKNLNKFQINNYKHDAKVTFKLCLGEATLRKSIATEEAAVLATASFYLCELRLMPNQHLNFLIPLT